MAISSPSAPRDARPTAAEVTARARSIVPDLRRLTFEAEKLRRLPGESMALVREHELIRTIQPRSCGGHELSMRAHVDVVSTLAEGCGATAWVVGVCQAHSWIMGHLPRRAQLEVYGDDPDAVVSAVIGPRGKAVVQSDGSYVLNGTWPFGSGCEHSQWLLLGSEIFDRDGNKLYDADLLVPTSSVELKDDWYVAGLQGTGSCSIVARESAVPAHRSVRLDLLVEGELESFSASEESWLSNAQAIPVLGLCISSGALGIARTALAEFVRSVPNKKVQYTPHVAHEWIPTQAALGQAASTIHAAELILYRVADDIDEYARSGARMPKDVRGRIRMDCSLAVRLCLESVERLFMNAGASSLALSSPVQLAARNLRATNMHGLLLLETSAEIFGRILFGLESNSPIY